MSTMPKYSSLPKWSGWPPQVLKSHPSLLCAPGSAAVSGTFHHSSFHSKTKPPSAAFVASLAERFLKRCAHSLDSHCDCIRPSTPPSGGCAAELVERKASVPNSPRNIGLPLTALHCSKSGGKGFERETFSPPKATL